MVELEDISRALRCPNYLACPGGVLSDVVTETKPMCREGGPRASTWSDFQLGCLFFFKCGISMSASRRESMLEVLTGQNCHTTQQDLCPTVKLSESVVPCWRLLRHWLQHLLERLRKIRQQRLYLPEVCSFPDFSGVIQFTIHEAELSISS